MGKSGEDGVADGVDVGGCRGGVCNGGRLDGFGGSGVELEDAGERGADEDGVGGDKLIACGGADDPGGGLVAAWQAQGELLAVTEGGGMGEADALSGDVLDDDVDGLAEGVGVDGHEDGGDIDRGAARGAAIVFVGGG